MTASYRLSRREPARMSGRPDRFVLRRDVDHTGLSGVGTVAEGIRFSDGRVALRWVGSEHASTVIWNSLDDVEAIHRHNGDTVVVWID